MLKFRLVVFFWFLIFLSACASSTPNLAKPETPADLPRKLILDAVPQYYQKGPNCGPISLQMVLAYYGVNLPKKQIEEDVRSGRGTSPVSLMKYAQSQGFKVEDKYSGTINDLAGNLAKGRPVIVKQWMKTEAKLRQVSSHYRVVLGYDVDSQTIYMRDPNKSGLSRASFQEFNELWDMATLRGGSAKNWLLVIYK